MRPLGTFCTAFRVSFADVMVDFVEALHFTRRGLDPGPLDVPLATVRASPDRALVRRRDGRLCGGLALYAAGTRPGAARHTPCQGACYLFFFFITLEPGVE